MNSILFCIDVYTVTEGDTLYSIAEKYDLPVSLLMKVNGISDPYNLLVGTHLCIPGDISQLPENIRPAAESHEPEIKEDNVPSLERMEEMRETRVESSSRADEERHDEMCEDKCEEIHEEKQEEMQEETCNEMREQQNQLFEILRQVMGQQKAEQMQQAIRTEQRIQQQQQQVHTPSSASTPKPKTHTVKAGDTLYLIARMHNIKLDDLMDANPNVDPYNLMIGSVLRLPY